MARIGNLDYDSAAASDLIPDGEYEAQIVESSIGPNKAGDGKVLTLVFDITVGGARRRHWERLSVVNKNQDAVRIATRTLMSIAQSVGVPIPVQDSDDLHFKPMLVKVATREGKNSYGPSNSLQKFSPWRATGGRQGVGSEQRPAQARSPAAPAKAGAGEDMPWD